MNTKTVGAMMLGVVGGGSLLGGCAAKQFDAAKMAEMEAASQAVVAEMQATEPYFAGIVDKSVAHAVFPKIGTGAFGWGAGLGSGLLFEDGQVTGTCRMTQVSAGWQIGGGIESQVVLFFSDEALADFKDGDFAFGTRGIAVIARKGVGSIEDFHGAADEYSQPKVGVMAGLAGALDFYKFRPLGG